MSDLASIRIWDGSKSRAFEELCYQLLREPEDLPLVGSTPIRTGNPDGGVEWYVNTPVGGEWGWQAKFIFEIDTLLSAMTVTVERIASERPSLSKLTFCIPWNLPAGTSGRLRVSARQKYEQRVNAWRRSISGANQIDFQLKQESDLLDRLAMPKHQGRQWFWFNESYLGPDQLGAFYRTQSAVAGDRYRPELQVDLPIGDDLRALGFSDRYFKQLASEKLKVLRAARYLPRPTLSFGADVGQALDEALVAYRKLDGTLRHSTYLASENDPLHGLIDAAQSASKKLGAAVSAFYAAEREAEDASKGEDTRRTQTERLRSDAYTLQRLSRAVEELCSFLGSEASGAVERRSYFLSGGAGTGKTHLLLDAVRAALEEGRPAAVLFGGRFGDADLWGSICDQLGLPPVGRDALLGALDAAAEAAGQSGRRFLLMVDALNETPSPNFWARHLPSLRAEVLQWHHLALAVSCRDTYLDTVDPDNRRAEFTVRSHPGFAGREVEAAHIYFGHYRLAEPRVPLLLPEFSVPLFLQFYCEALRDEGRTAPPDHHESRVVIFDRFLETRIRRAARRLAPDGSDFELHRAEDHARAALDAVLGDLARSGREGLRRDNALEIAAAALPAAGPSAVQVVSALLDEGLLNQELLYLDGASVPGLRITFQAFADFLILRKRLVGIVERDGLLSDDTFRAWLADASFGIQEAASVLLPEVYGIELLDFLDPAVRTRIPKDAHPRYVEDRLQRLEHMFLETLPYRSAGSVSDRSLAILNSGLRHGLADELFRVLFLLAPQPDHPLNGGRLHAYLSRFSMPARDEFFGKSVYNEYGDEASSAARLGRWAALGPYGGYDPGVVELAAIPLVWLLSSPNRFMRDWTTKALAQLLSGHPDVLCNLVDRFTKVDDAYVVERVLAVAYGAAMRSDMVHHAAMGRVAELVAERIFEGPGGPPADAFVIDNARGLVEWAVAHHVIDQRRLGSATPRYGFKRPGNPWTKQTIESRFERGRGNAPSESYSTLFFSLFDGDFGRYVVESGVHHFARTPLSKPPPERQLPGERKFVRARFRRFVEKLGREQRDRLEAILKVDAQAADKDAVDEFHRSLSIEQARELAECWQFPLRRWRDDSYSAEHANRWIFQRVLSLGWTPARFGEFDRMRGYGDGRSAHKAERFGKKYQWIAYHELLARIADNYHLDAMYRDEFGTYGGLHQIHDREIDPSLPPMPFEDLFRDVESDSTSSPGGGFPGFPPLSPRFQRYQGDVRRFVEDHDSLPLPERILRVRDASTDSWLLVDGTLDSLDADPNDTDRATGLEQWAAIVSWLVPRAKSARFRRALARALPGRRWFLDTHGHVNCCLLGELGWRPLRCPHRVTEISDLVLDDVATLPAASVSEDYAWEGSGFDCSLTTSSTTTAPSAFLQNATGIVWAGSGSEWRAESGEVVAVHIGERGFHESHGLVLRESWLRGVLDRQSLALVTGVFGERRRLAGEKTYREPWLEYSGVATLSPSGKVVASTPVFEHHEGPDST